MILQANFKLLIITVLIYPMSSPLKTDLSIESTFKILTEHPLPTWVIDARDLSILFASRSASEKYGIKPDEFLQLNFLDIFSEESRLFYFQKTANRNDSSLFEGRYSHIKNDGNRIDVELFASRIEFKSVKCIQVSCVDMTGKINEAQKLYEESLRYKTYIDHSTDGIYCQEYSIPVAISNSFEKLAEHSKSHSYISECNDAMARMYGFDKADELKGVLTEQLLDFNDPTNLQFFRAFVEQGFKIVNAISHEKDRFGNTRYFLNNAIGVIENGYLKRIWGTQQDITEKKRTEEKLQLLANLVEQSSDIITAADNDYRPVTWNKAAEKIYGISAEQIIGRYITDFIDIHYVDASREMVRGIIKEKGSWSGEAFFVRPADQKQVTLMITFKQMMDEKGVSLGYLVTAKEITERKEAESKLLESESRFRNIADSSPVMIWMSNENDITIYTNKKWMEFTGVDIKGKADGWSRLVHKDDLTKAKRIYDKAFEQKKQVTIIYRLLHKSGNYRWVHDVSVPRFSDGKFIGFIGSVVDIEDQKQKEQQLRYQSTILENVSDIIVTTDLDFKVKSWNASAEIYFEIKEQDAQGRKMSDLLRYEFKNSSLEEVIGILKTRGQWKGEVTTHNSKGEAQYFLFSIKEIFDSGKSKLGFLAVGKDVTERTIAEENMKKSEEFYRTLIADSLDGMILLDKEGTISFSSPSIKNVLGYEVDEIVGRNAFEFVHPDDLLWAANSFEKEVVENPLVKFIVVRVKTKAGNWQWCMARGHNMLKNPSVNSIVVYLHDDTLRKQASEALKESEKRFRNLIRDLQIGVFMADKEGKIMLCNRAFSKMMSIPEDVLTGLTLPDFINDSVIDENGTYIPVEKRPLNRSLISKEAVKDSVIGIIHPLTRERLWMMVNAEPVFDENGHLLHVINSVLDITERKKLENKLVFEQIGHQRQLTQATLDGQEAERKEIGKELHDNIGQQLTTIKLFLDLAKSTADDTTNEMVSMALKGVGDVINEIRAISRSLIPSTLQDLGLVESIGELIDSISRAQLMEIVFDHMEFNEDALPENQKLTLFRIVQEQLNNIVKHSAASNVLITLVTNDKGITLEVKDDGIGFNPEKIKRGLGFINIANRAELFGGKKQVITGPGQGCVLKVCFPDPRSFSTDPTLPISLT